MTYTGLIQCLACGGDNLQPYFDAGDQPLANSFHDGPTELPRFPLGLQVCIDCFHSQQKVAVDPDLMFKNYPYVSGTSETLRVYFEDFVSRVESKSEHPRLRVLDIASNDGTLLKEFKKRGHLVLGVDPAANLRPLSKADDIETIVGYWNADLVRGTSTKFDVIIAMNVLGHVADPLTFLALAKQVLAPGGRIYIQTSQARMVERGEFDTVYHEHLSFFTVRSFLSLAKRAGLTIAAIDHVDIHGTSYLIEMIAEPLAKRTVEDFACGWAEIGFGYYQSGVYDTFQERAAMTVDWVKSTIEQHREMGYRVVGYGAAAKGMTFLNFAGIDLEFIVDDNPLKIGKLTPGRNIPVWGSNELKPDIPGSVGTPMLFVIMAWNFYPEIVSRIKGQRVNELDRFLTYFPVVTIT